MLTHKLPKILIVSDAESSVATLRSFLNDVKVEFSVVPSLARAVEEAASQELALILVDLEKFGVTEIEAVQKLKAPPSSAATPIILVTNEKLEREIEIAAYRAGLSDIVQKPVAREILSSKVRLFVDLYNQENAASETKYRTLFESVDQGFCILEMIYDDRDKPVDYRFLEYNPTFERQTGLTAAFGKTVKQLVPDLDTFWFETYGKVASSGEAIRFEQDAPAMDRTFDVYAFRIGDAPSKLVGLLFSDITEKKRAQVEYERSVDVSPAILWITEIDGSCTYLSKQWYDYTGQTKEQALGFGWLDATHPDDKTPTADIYINANKEQKPFYAEYRLKTKDGSYRWAIDAGNPRYDKDGKYLGYAGTVFDIHERKLAEQAAEIAKERTIKERLSLEEVLNQTTIPIALLEGPDHQFTYSNKAYSETFELNGSPVGRYVHEVFPDAARQGFGDLLNKVYSTGESFHGKEVLFERRNPNSPPKDFYLDFTYAAKRNSQGKIEGVLAAIVDVTEKVFSRKEIEIAKDEAERANELKSAFLANMSHEIRTPLGAMLGFADLLKDPSLSNNERSNFIDILSRNGDQLSVIINDILDLSKVEAGHLTLEYTDFYPAKLAEEALSLLRVKAKEKDLVLEYVSDGTAPHNIVSDPTRVRQILLNLVSNAVKFTKYGTVTIKSYGCKTEDGRDAACFEIADTGIGLSQDKKESIFEAFVQADNSMTRRFGGTGLGLALSRQLARALEGDITVLKTEENVGTTFLLKIADQPEKREAIVETHQETKKAAEVLAPDALKGVRVLVVDDAPDNQALIWRFLTKYGAIVDSAENGYLGYRKALSTDFDIVLMDLQMPEMDGYTATHKLRSAGFQKPIIALTAHAMSEVRQKCMNVGCSAHLPKPINSRDLVSEVVRLTAHR